MRRGLLAILLLGLACTGASATEPFKIQPPGERVLQSGIEGISGLVIVEGGGRSEGGRVHSDLRGRFRLELGGLTHELRDGSGFSIDPDTGRESALAELPARLLDLHDFISYALESRAVFAEVEMVDEAGLEWAGRNPDGTSGKVYRDDRGRISGYEVELPDQSRFEVRFLDWMRFADFELPTRARTIDAQGTRVWRIASYQEEAMQDVGHVETPRWLKQGQLPAEAIAALTSERTFAMMSRTEGMKAAFLEWLVPGGTVFGPGPMSVEDRYAVVSDDKAEQPALEWLPEWIVIAGSRELAVITGRWFLVPVGAEHPTDFGQYLSVWARSGEEWRVLADIGTDQPEQRDLTPKATGRMIEALTPRAMMIPDPVKLAEQVEGEFQEVAFKEGYLSTLRARADRDVIVLRVGAAAAQGVDHLTVPESVADLGPRIEVVGSAASAAHDFLATWGVMHFGLAEGGQSRLAFLRVWQLEISRWQIIADVYREMP